MIDRIFSSPDVSSLPRDAQRAVPPARRRRSSFPPHAAVPFPSSAPMDGEPPPKDDGCPIAMDGQAAKPLAASALAARGHGLAAAPGGLGAPPGGLDA